MILAFFHAGRGGVSNYHLLILMDCELFVLIG